MSQTNNSIKIVEVGPRDGLQSIKFPIPTQIKIEYIDKLSEAQFPEIEITGFVHPEWIPQLSDSSEVSKNITRNKSITYTALVPNLEGAIRAVEHGINSISVITAASEIFSLKNTNCSINKSIKKISEIIDYAQEHDIKIRTYISTCWDCPYTGIIKPKMVKLIIDQLYQFEIIREFVLSDTTGKATAESVQYLMDILFTEFDPSNFALHFHDSFGQAEDNLRCGLNNGITTFDSSTGGIGGCPFSPGAKGNIASHKAVSIINDLGFSTGINKAKLDDAGIFINSAISNIQLS
ncbi:MAG: hydroxymethylglutaryl-CoA lyase [Candidatus Marinimicrobia bacterium]|jgi:hydroxymethylglutaryl-CoA lyase|nr:hydroxymethylglutaryl-CoA lyase [Candidatus Neomarinimicrobiota bacterium]HJM48089.1 hydroxymethylglutaryl-CoA lyase [Candidatus Neomarinimicrobiota bacterium]|tara:strand:+ start:5370 stop:6248 length:879 start_codon:yes stop_codon:yes gene_type:complete